MKILQWSALLLLCAALLLLAGLYAWRDRVDAEAAATRASTDGPQSLQPATPIGTESANSNEQMTSAASLADPHPDPAAVERSLQQQFLQARSVSDAQLAVKAAHAAGFAAALDWEIDLANCGRTTDLAMDTPETTASREALRERQRRFCEGYVPTDLQHRLLHGPAATEEEALALTAATQRERSKRSIIERLSATDPQEDVVANLLTELLTAATSQPELNGLLIGAQSMPTNGFASMCRNLWHRHMPGAYVPADERCFAVFESVGWLYGCWRFGGCGPDSRLALYLCLAGKCPQPMSVEQYVQYYALSPAEFEGAMAILRGLQRASRR